jgi:branched-chain amino acid transport system permease protein
MLDLLSYGAFFLTMALTYAIICLGLNVQWGQTGLFNVGVAGFVAVGAYASALLTTPDDPARVGGFGLPIAAGWLGGALAAGPSPSSSAPSPSACAPTISPSPPSASR